MKQRIEVLDSEVGFDGFLQLKRYRLRHSLYSGGMSRELVRERVERLRAVAVLLYDPDLDRVVLVEQFRIGALEQGVGAWLIEIVGGMWDRDIDPEEVAHKEAVEEAGCEILQLMPIGDVWVSPGTSCERVKLYCGRVNAGHVGGFHGLDHEGEDIRVVSFALQEALQALEQGRISAATAVLALQWLAMNRGRVHKRWCGNPVADQR
jgi:ADP-ribose pyrophosphatase